MTTDSNKSPSAGGFGSSLPVTLGRGLLLTADEQASQQFERDPASWIYYFDIGHGLWKGGFTFGVTHWRTFWADKIGLKNRFLVVSMAALMRLFGKASLLSRVSGDRDRGEAGVADNDVRISRFGITLYVLREQYFLHGNGRDVTVRAHERFGPIPLLFNVHKDHPAEIFNAGMSSRYYLPLLGTSWLGDYTVSPDRNHIESVLTCTWAEAREVVDRVVWDRAP